MRHFLPVIAVLLLAGLTASSAGALAFMVPAPQVTRPAQCHGGASIPAPAPTSHRCCIAGHNPALPGSLFSGHVSLACFGFAENAEVTASTHRAGGIVSILIAFPLGSPGSLSLRI